ncbi:MAG: hypothetical protein BRD45_05795 [Bacteroidetes bacterium QS_8_64_10]|jgi:hypothetical protein|nr:MAG: hypothetical protein BRD45_05795 [Bacteroidetes bacterium QS_8_64_10]
MSDAYDLIDADSLPPSLASVSASKDDDDTKLLLIDFRSGESVSCHPSVAPLLEDGWTLQRATPRVVEEEGCKLLVILSRRGSAPKKFSFPARL